MNMGLVVLKDKQKELAENIKDKYQEIRSNEFSLKSLKTYKEEIDRSVEILEESGECDAYQYTHQKAKGEENV